MVGARLGGNQINFRNSENQIELNCCKPQLIVCPRMFIAKVLQQNSPRFLTGTLTDLKKVYQLRRCVPVRERVLQERNLTSTMLNCRCTNQQQVSRRTNINLYPEWRSKAQFKFWWIWRERCSRLMAQAYVPKLKRVHLDQYSRILD
jgi:hypothetical protein